MNNRQAVIYGFIMSLAKEYPYVLTSQIKEIIDKYVYNDTSNFTLREVQTLIKNTFDRLNYIEPDKNNIFISYNIKNPNDFLTFLINNFEYGFYDKDTNLLIPYDDYNYLSISNKVISYNNQDLINYLKRTYEELPKYYKNNDNDIDKYKKAENSILFNKWSLNYYDNSFTNLVGILPDLIEFESKYFDSLKLDYQRYAFTSIKNPSRYHSFIAYKMNNKWYYFEYILKPFRGIYEFDSQEELERVVYSKLVMYYLGLDNDISRISDITDLDKNKLNIINTTRNNAFYNFKMASTYRKDKDISVKLGIDGLKEWYDYLNLIKDLPNYLNLYSLKKIRKVKKNMTFFEYIDMINYQSSIEFNNTNLDIVLELLNKQKLLYNLVKGGYIEPGKLELDNDFITFNKIDSNLLNDNIMKLGFASFTNARSVYSLASDGNFIEYKGVDPLTGLKRTLNFDVIKYRNLIGDDSSPYALELIQKKDESTYLMFRGTYGLEELQQEKNQTRELRDMGFNTGDFINVNMFPRKEIIKYNLPMLDEYFEDYLVRIKKEEFLDKRETIRFSRENNKGFRISQAVKKVSNFLSILDLFYGLEKNDKEKTKLIFNFFINYDSKNYDSKTLIYNFSRRIGKQVAILYNNNYYFFNSNNLNNILLDGEMNDSHFVNFDHVKSKLEKSISKLESIENRNNNKEIQLGIQKEKLEDEIVKYYFQFVTFISSLRVVNNSYKLLYDKDLWDVIPTIFIGSILSNLEDSKRDEFQDYFLSITNYDNVIDELIEDNNLVILSEEFRSDIKSVSKLFVTSLNNIDKSIESAKELIDKLDFINTSLNLCIEDKFEYYLKILFKEKSLSLKDYYKVITNDDSIGLLIKNDQIMNTALERLSKYSFNSIDDFYKMAKLLIKEQLTTDSVELYKIDSYKNKFENSNRISITFDDKDRVIPFIKKKANSETSGNASLFIFLVSSGFTLIAVGIIISIMHR